LVAGAAGNRNGPYDDYLRQILAGWWSGQYAAPPWRTTLSTVTADVDL
jgi:hypothetical protein